MPGRRRDAPSYGRNLIRKGDMRQSVNGAAHVDHARDGRPNAKRGSRAASPFLRPGKECVCAPYMPVFVLTDCEDDCTSPVMLVAAPEAAVVVALLARLLTVGPEVWLSVPILLIDALFTSDDRS